MSGAKLAEHSDWIGTRVRAMRIKRRISQKDLARRLGISQYQLCKYERGANRISFEAMVEIADILGAPLEAFRPPKSGDRLLAALRRASQPQMPA